MENYKVIEVSIDSSQEELVKQFEESYLFIREGLDAGNNVLLHDEKGVQRAPTFAMSFLIYENGITAEEAFK